MINGNVGNKYYADNMVISIYEKKNNLLSKNKFLNTNKHIGDAKFKKIKELRGF
jgi:hypothetical protein